MSKLLIFVILFNLVRLDCVCAEIDSLSIQRKNTDTINISYSEQVRPVITWKHQYDQTLTLKLFLSQALFDGKLKRRDNGQCNLFLTFAQILEVIKKIDNLSLGIPKIIYLVGWQYNGHDSKYPAWFEANEQLKRPQDKTALESLRWLMNKAKKYHTTVSLHINMFDAYEDSPLWNTYVKNNIIARNADGTLRAAEWGYPVSYAQEWKTGFTQKRIDSLCCLLPIQKSGTIHIDAFHSWPPIPVFDKNGDYRINSSEGPISPFLDFTVADETEAQRNIFRYWASKGVDVTSEGVDFLRETSFDGYQPMAWWYGGLQNYLKWPASYYCGGQDNSEWGKLFGTSMHGEDIIKEDPLNLSGFSQQFCQKTAVWYFLNRLDRKYVVIAKDYKSVQFSNDIRTFLSGDKYIISQGGVVLVENEDVFIPALWLEKPSIIAYSKNGYKDKEWKLPKEWKDVHSVKLNRVSIKGKSWLENINIQTGILKLTLANDEMVLIEKM